MYSEFIKDLETLEIEVKENLTIKFVTTKYRNLAKEIGTRTRKVDLTLTFTSYKQHTEG